MTEIWDDGATLGPDGYPYKLCRVHHAWGGRVDPPDVPDYPWPHLPFKNRWSEECTRCGKWVHMAISDTGAHLYPPQYDDVPGYYLPADDTPSKGGFRAELIQEQEADRAERRAQRQRDTGGQP